ncbi:MAG: C1 family peptidase [Alphaproteobacteria bacterium]|nr:C1 family peptidase [Alphaproteobacteria bacterium]
MSGKAYGDVQCQRCGAVYPDGTGSCYCTGYSVNGRSLTGCLMEGRTVKAPILQAPGSSLPDRVDMRAYCSPVEDQLKTNSCTANAIVGALEYHQRKAGRGVTDLSRLFVYFNARKLADTQLMDCGSHIHHVMAAMLAYGACEERIWPFDEENVTALPGQEVYENAAKHEAFQYARSPLGQSAMQAVAAGLPVVFGTYIPGSYYEEAAKTGIMPGPKGRAEPQAGGHAMLIVGYDQPGRYWIVRNSWGSGWAERGYFKLPFDTLTTFSSPEHFWTVGDIEGAQGLSLSGPSMADFARTTQANAAEEAKAALDKLRKELRKDLSDDLDAAKKSIRDRLRGPGT